jgi:glutathione-independent formaldehyde dehydrogenase
LMMAILHDRIHTAKAVNVQIITLDQAPRGYKDFDRGAAKKFVIDPHGSLEKAA